MHPALRLLIVGICGGWFASWTSQSQAAEPLVLNPNDYQHYVDKFQQADVEQVVNLIPNDRAWEWMTKNVPWFDCPSMQLEEVYYFRWWSFRKHIKQADGFRVLTEFLTPVKHAGPANTVSCAVGHHIAEGRWLHDRALLDEYARFWFRSGQQGGPAPHFHKYSGWVASALYQRYLVTDDQVFLSDLLDDLVADYRVWESERQCTDGLFWQYDVRDAMEESISGGRTARNRRPTINSYMAGNALAISRIAANAGRKELAAEFTAKHDRLKKAMIESLWDKTGKFFKVQLENGQLSDAREAIGYIPWMFELAGPEHAEAWQQIQSAQGFWAPFGLTTAERRHPRFRSHGNGTCEWDGAVWPFATSQTLTGLTNYLRGPEPQWVTSRDFFEQLLAYARCHQQNGVTYIGEYLDETTGKWLITGPKSARSRYYNHSTFADLVITGLVGLVPRDDDVVELHPLIPEDAWDWFCLDNVPYHGGSLTVIWDRSGRRYGRGAGLSVWMNGVRVAESSRLERLSGAGLSRSAL